MQTKNIFHLYGNTPVEITESYIQTILSMFNFNKKGKDVLSAKEVLILYQSEIGQTKFEDENGWTYDCVYCVYVGY